jgi:hypothetical protein
MLAAARAAKTRGWASGSQACCTSRSVKWPLRNRAPGGPGDAGKRTACGGDGGDTEEASKHVREEEANEETACGEGGESATEAGGEVERGDEAAFGEAPSAASGDGDKRRGPSGEPPDDKDDTERKDRGDGGVAGGSEAGETLPAARPVALLEAGEGGGARGAASASAREEAAGCAAGSASAAAASRRR